MYSADSDRYRYKKKDTKSDSPILADERDVP